MASFKDMLKYYREREGLSQSQLAKVIGVSASTISMYEIGKREPDFETEEKIADYFNVSLSSLRGKNEVQRPTRVPVLGRVAAGIPMDAIEEIIDYEEIPEAMSRDGEYFGLKIKGDSMEPRIQNGDVVIVRKQSDADDGDLVIALVNGNEGMCKRLKKMQSGIMLLSNNPAYDPYVFSWDDINNLPVTIVGKVKELRGKF